MSQDTECSLSLRSDCCDRILVRGGDHQLRVYVNIAKQGTDLYGYKVPVLPLSNQARRWYVLWRV